MNIIFIEVWCIFKKKKRKKLSALKKKSGTVLSLKDFKDYKATIIKGNILDFSKYKS